MRVLASLLRIADAKIRIRRQAVRAGYDIGLIPRLSP